MKRYRRWRAYVRRTRGRLEQLWLFAKLLHALDERGFMIVVKAPGPVAVTFSDPQVPFKGGERLG